MCDLSLLGLNAGSFFSLSRVGFCGRNLIAKRLCVLRTCQRSLLDRLSSEDEDDIISDSAGLPCFFQVSNVR